MDQPIQSIEIINLSYILSISDGFFICAQTLLFQMQNLNQQNYEWGVCRLFFPYWIYNKTLEEISSEIYFYNNNFFDLPISPTEVTNILFLCVFWNVVKPVCFFIHYHCMANSADNKLMIFFLFLSRKQALTFQANGLVHLLEMSMPILWKKHFKMSFAEFFTQHSKH